MDNFIEMRADQLYDVDGGLFTLAAGAVALAAGFFYRLWIGQSFWLRNGIKYL